MIEANLSGCDVLCFPRLAVQTGLVHAVTLRPWNMAPHRGPDAHRAIERRRALCRALGLDFDRLTAPAQIHGADVLPIEPADIGRGRDGRDSAIPFVDGLLTDRPGVGIIMLSADCPPLLLYDPVRRVLGAGHASWRGTVAGIAANLVHQMTRSYGSRPQDLLAAIGPSAGPCCYAVGPEVRRIAATRLSDVDACVPRRDGRWYFDLWRALHIQLSEAGLKPENIETAAICSICDERLFSHRREGDAAGRYALIAGLTAPDAP